MATRRSVHVSRDGGRWKVSQGGSKVSTHNTQATAIGAARREARADRVDLVVHGRDGRIRSKDSYGNDPLPPRDREH